MHTLRRETSTGRPWRQAVEESDPPYELRSGVMSMEQRVEGS